MLSRISSIHKWRFTGRPPSQWFRAGALLSPVMVQILPFAVSQWAGYYLTVSPASVSLFVNGRWERHPRLMYRDVCEEVCGAQPPEWDAQATVNRPRAVQS